MNESQFVTVLLRMTERILSVGAAAMTIYFGYRLFVLVPTQQNSDGKIALPNFSVVLTKVGPGVFFALFGAAILYQSLSSSIKVDATSFSGTMERDPAAAAVRPDAASTAEAIDAAAARRDIEALSCMQTQLAAAGRGSAAADVDRAVRDAKAALARSAGDLSLADLGCTPAPASRPR